MDKLHMLEPCNHLYGHKSYDQIAGWLNFDSDVNKSQETLGFNIHVVEETDGHFTQTLGSLYGKPGPRSQAFNGPFPTRARAPTSGTTTCPRASNRCHLLHVPSLPRSLDFRSRIQSQSPSCRRREVHSIRIRVSPQIPNSDNVSSRKVKSQICRANEGRRTEREGRSIAPQNDTLTCLPHYMQDIKSTKGIAHFLLQSSNRPPHTDRQHRKRAIHACVRMVGGSCNRE